MPDLKEAKPKRRSVSKGRRFEIFKRDGFRCIYCGATPPGVVLHVDHVVPIAEGGNNCAANLVTACDRCNLGKGATLLGQVPAGMRVQATQLAAEAKERQEQIRAYYEILAQEDQRLEEEAWEVVEEFAGDPETTEFRSDWFRSVRLFLGKLDSYTVRALARTSHSVAHHGADRQFAYFCGCCWNEIRRRGGR